MRLKNEDGKSWLLGKHRDKYSLDTDYNSEHFSRHKKMEDKRAEDDKRIVRPKKTTAKIIHPSVIGRKLNNPIKPMLASVSENIFDYTDWLYELKLDGYRAIAELGNEEIRLYSRNGLSFFDKYPVLSEALKKIKHNAVLDGEIVLLDEVGKPSFQKLQHYEANPGHPLVYYFFDLLMLNGFDTTGLELTKRKELLKKLLGKNKIIKYCAHIPDKGSAFYKKVVSQNMEAIIAKFKNSTYHPGIRSKH